MLRNRVVGLLSMIAAALIVVTCSVPASAVEASATAALGAGGAASASFSLSHREPTTRPQSIPGGTAAPAAIQRDGYTVTAAPPPPPSPVLTQTASAPNGSTVIHWPVPSSTPVSGPFGPRIAPCAGCSTFHKGVDLTPGLGTPIHAIGDGVVTQVSATDSSGLGVYAVIAHLVNGRKVSSVYGHMIVGSLLVHVGETVSIGQQLGNVGSTGQSTGPHLHFEILLDNVTPTNPIVWLHANATG